MLRVLGPLETKTGVAALSIASNLTLTLLKLAVGLLIGSVSVVAEAIHSGVDLLAAVIAYVAVRNSGKPPDERYPFGRGKFENASGTVEAALIFLAAGLIVSEAVGKLLHGTELPEVNLGLGVMAVSVVANTVVSRQLFRVARRTDSVALEADAYHLTTDIATSAGVFVGLVVVKLTGLALLDPLVAIGVAALIGKAAWDITRRSFVDLLDRSLPESDRQLIAEVLDRHSGLFVGYHRIRTRKAGAERHIDLHLVVRGDSPVREAHATCDHLERELREALGPCSLNIHIEPDSDGRGTLEEITDSATSGVARLVSTKRRQMMGSGYGLANRGDRGSRDARPVGAGGRRVRVAVGAASCATAGAAGLLVGFSMEDTLLEIVSPAVFNVLVTLLIWGRGLFDRSR